MDNQTSMKIPAEELASVIQKLDEVQDLLHPYMQSLEHEERKNLPAFSERSIPFMEKTMEYIKTRPELNPVFVDIIEMDTNWKTVKELSALFQQCNQLHGKLYDALRLAAQDVHRQTMSYYHVVKMAAESKVAAAEAVHTELNRLMNGVEEISVRKEAIPVQ